jgi:hypothetical protein
VWYFWNIGENSVGASRDGLDKQTMLRPHYGAFLSKSTQTPRSDFSFVKKIGYSHNFKRFFVSESQQLNITTSCAKVWKKCHLIFLEN